MGCQVVFYELGTVGSYHDKNLDGQTITVTMSKDLLECSLDLAGVPARLNVSACPILRSRSKFDWKGSV